MGRETPPRWVLHTDRGDVIRARYLVMAPGILNLMKLPAIPGMEQFRGRSFHTARWDYDYTGGRPDDPHLTNSADKVVGIIGTGASAIQASRRWRRRRSTSTCSSARRRRSVCVATDPTTAEFAELSARVATGPHGELPGRDDRACPSNGPHRRRLDPPLCAWSRIRSRRRTCRPKTIAAMRRGVRLRGDGGAPGSGRGDRDRSRRVAEILKPYYRYLCKRPCFHDEYLDAFNRPDVTLVDCPAGIERVTERGVVVDGQEYRASTASSMRPVSRPSSRLSPTCRSPRSSVATV